MKVAVWDTYVKREDGLIMHFDILVPDTIKDETIIFKYGQEFLKSLPIKTGELTATECRFCHIEQATKEIVAAINTHGFYIIKMENYD